MSAAEYLPNRLTLPALERAARTCQGCELYKNATQTVFGEGPANARLFFIGEQPGDREDVSGHPFVGPAGRYFDGALEKAGIDRADVYVTNAVKHFKWTPAGKRRLHKKPGAREIAACRPWLEAELEVVKPEVVVCLGATAAQAVMGRAFRITQDRGTILSTEWSERTLATWHPSALLRVPDPDQKIRMEREFLSDLKLAAKQLAKRSTIRT